MQLRTHWLVGALKMLFEEVTNVPVSSVILVEEDAELESRALCLVVFGRNDGTSSFCLRQSDTRASANLPRRRMMCPEAER